MEQVLHRIASWFRRDLNSLRATQVLRCRKGVLRLGGFVGTRGSPEKVVRTMVVTSQVRQDSSHSDEKVGEREGSITNLPAMSKSQVHQRLPVRGCRAGKGKMANFVDPEHP